MDLQRKKNKLFLILAGVFITNAILAELIGVKIFSLEATLGLEPASIKLFGDFVLDFNLTAGALIWPVVFITTDVINEYFGRIGVRRVTFLTVALIIYAFLVILVVSAVQPAQFWLDINGSDPEGNAFDINYAYGKVFRQSAGIIIGSLVAFMIGQFLDVFVFQKLRRITGKKMIWLRATGSTLISQLIDSFVVLFIAFYIFAKPPWSLTQVLSVGIINYTYKFVVAILLTPLIYVAHSVIDRYLGVEAAERMADEAAESSNKFL